MDVMSVLAAPSFFLTRFDRLSRRHFHQVVDILAIVAMRPNGAFKPADGFEVLAR
jgi:hypothetical protein